MSLGEFLPSSSTKLCLHLNGNSLDSSSSGNNGTDTSITYSQANGRFGQGAGFNGQTSGASKIVTTDTDVDYITLSVWVYSKRSNPGSAKGDIVISKDGVNGGSNTRAYGLYFSWNSNVFSINLEIWNTSATGVSVVSNDVSINKWHNIVVTFDGSKVKLYVDGVFKNETNLSGTIRNISDKITLGESNENQTGSNGSAFLGNIDEVIIVNRAWSAEEVKKYYTNSLGRFANL